MPADDPLPLPLDDPAEPVEGRSRVTCRMCGRRLHGREQRLRGLGDGCRAKLDQRTAPRPAASTVEQDTIPGV